MSIQIKCFHCTSEFNSDTAYYNHLIEVERYPEEDANAEAARAVERARLDDVPKCPDCNSVAYCCNHPHTDGAGPRLHCTSASLHNFKLVDGKWVRA